LDALDRAGADPVGEHEGGALAALFPFAPVQVWPLSRASILKKRMR
jgi:hypothetical protein